MPLYNSSITTSLIGAARVAAIPYRLRDVAVCRLLPDDGEAELPQEKFASPPQRRNCTRPHSPLLRFAPRFSHKTSQKSSSESSAGARAGQVPHRHASASKPSGRPFRVVGHAYCGSCWVAGEIS
jgi:hypothetical protein